ncbi:MAG: VanZ family protein [Reichenbachiella sp.]
MITIIWTLVILFATLSESDGEKSWLAQIPHFDKLVHACLFFIWSTTLGMSFKTHPAKNVFSFALVIMAGILLGFGTEYFQTYVPGRTADPLDFIFDSLGLGFGLVFTFIIKNKD